MMKLAIWAAAAAAAALSVLLGASAQAQQAGHTVTVTFAGVRSGNGEVLAGLCGDRSAPFPGACLTYRTKAKATAGQTVLTFTDVAPGSYAMQAWHDENGDGRMNFPNEGYALGSDAPVFPPKVDLAAIRVGGDTTTRATVIYRGAEVTAPKPAAQ